MARIIALLFGIAAYGVFFLTFLYLIGFIGNLVVPKSIDAGPASPTLSAFLINLGLIGLFGVQHSVMARQGFKALWKRIVPASVERSTYVLISSAVLILLFWLWQPMGQVVWHIEAPWARTLMWSLFGAGFLIVLLSTFNIDHFDLFGLRQVVANLRRSTYRHPRFQVTWFYRFVRHPLYSGFILAFWANPTMTVGHLLFAAAMTTYILIAIRYEERDLLAFHGNEYREYRERVPALVPLPGGSHERVDANDRVGSY